MKQLKLTLLFLFVNFGGLALGNIFMNRGPLSEWYMNLNKAPWTPDGWVFGVAWTTIMICFSVYLGKLFSKKPIQKKYTVAFIIQFTLNVSWNFLFFNLQYIFLGLVNLMLLLVTICFFYYESNKKTSYYKYLNLPYIIWLIIATSLNLYILIEN